VTYRLIVLRPALKAVASLDKPVRVRVQAAIDALAHEPRPPGCVKLTGREAWRIRIGDHRVVYEIRDAALVVMVVDVGHRREVYR
jgi:mRNA interferase RelE/StbE